MQNVFCDVASEPPYSESESRSDEIERAAKRRARCKKGGRDGLGSPAMFRIRIIILAGIMLIDNNIIPTLC